MIKKTRLDDDASIYSKRGTKTEKQKWNEMNRKEKIDYFRDYYMKKLIIGIFITGLAIYFIYTVVSPKPKTILSIAIMDYNVNFQEETVNQIENDLNDILKVDPDTQEIFIDTNYLSNDYASAQRFTTYVYSGDIDILIAPKSKFEGYAFNGNMSSLADKLPTDLYTELSDNFFYSKVEKQDETPENATGSEDVYGIILSETEIFQRDTAYYDKEDPPVLGIMINSKNIENTIEFIRYLFDY